MKRNSFTAMMVLRPITHYRIISSLSLQCKSKYELRLCELPKCIYFLFQRISVPVWKYFSDVQQLCIYVSYLNNYLKFNENFEFVAIQILNFQQLGKLNFSCYL